MYKIVQLSIPARHWIGCISEVTVHSKQITRTLPALCWSNAHSNMKYSSSSSCARKMGSKLPPLPVPPLKETLSKLLTTVKPLVTPEEFKATENVVNEFGSGVGEKLQFMLEEKASRMDNWMSEYWLDAAYLGFRYPVTVWSSPGLVFPLRDFTSEDDRLDYAAMTIAATLDYKRIMLDGNGLPQEKMGKDPLDMTQYHQVLGTCRVPGLPKDSMMYCPDSQHCVVVHNNNFFKLYCYDDKGKPIPQDSIKEQLSFIVEQSKHVAPPVGILSGDERDTWANAYEALCQDNKNQQTIEEIQSSLFLVCLDKDLPADCYPNRKTVAAHLCLHGGGSKENTGNRWFDKTIQFCISPSGEVGLTYEHAPAEGGVITHLMDHIVDYVEKGGEAAKRKWESCPNVYEPEKLEFTVSDEVKKAILRTKRNVDKLIADTDMFALHFREYGKEFIKSQKLSPDSYIQMGIQYAYYRLHGVPAAHYESASLRKYTGGRTEAIRSCSLESVAFAQAMMDSNKSDKDKADALRKAIDSHKKYTLEALNARGVDRHLLGLKLIANENCIELPKLYSDPGYLRSSHMKLSTSQVPGKCDAFMCYGPLTTDGYGCCYNPRAYDINFGISSLRSNPITDTIKFKDSLVACLTDMHDLLMKLQKCKL